MTNRTTDPGQLHLVIDHPGPGDWHGRQDVLEALEAAGWTGDEDMPLSIVRHPSGAVWAVANECDDSGLDCPNGATVEFPCDTPTVVVVAACLAAAAAAAVAPDAASAPPAAPLSASQPSGVSESAQSPTGAPEGALRASRAPGIPQPVETLIGSITIRSESVQLDNGECLRDLAVGDSVELRADTGHEGLWIAAAFHGDYQDQITLQHAEVVDDCGNDPVIACKFSGTRHAHPVDLDGKVRPRPTP